MQIRKHSLTILSCFFVLFSQIYAQDLSGHIKTISEALQTVAASKTEYAQIIKNTTSNYINYHINEIDTKGNSKETIFNFSFADVDINTVRTITKKDVILVQLIIKSKQKLIKKTTNNGDKVGYVDNIYLYAKNIDNGRELVKAIKEIIPINETLEKNKLALTSYKDHQNWLVNNIKDIDFIKNQIIQKIEFGASNNGNIKLNTTINSKSKTINYNYEFNLATINPNSLTFRINGDEFHLEITNRRNIKAIKVYKDGQQENYTGKLRLYCADIENANDLYKVLKAAIPLAEKAFEKSKPNISSTENAINYINTTLQDVLAHSTTYTQYIKGDCVSKIGVTEANIKETIAHEFSLNFADINLDNIDYSSSKNELYVEINTRKQAKFIRHIKNNALQNYANALKLYVNNIEEAMLTKEAFQRIVKNCEVSKTVNHSTIPKALEGLKKEITIVKVGDNSYDQTFEIVTNSPYVVKLTSVYSNLKSSKETIYEFGLKDINPKTIAITTSGKYAMVELSTRHLEKIIKTYQDGEIKSYAHKIAIQATDIENARNIRKILIYTIQKLE